jgi:hypothetical protein
MAGVLNVMTNSAAVQIIVCHVSNVSSAFSLDDFRPMHSSSTPSSVVDGISTGKRRSRQLRIADYSRLAGTFDPSDKLALHSFE